MLNHIFLLQITGGLAAFITSLHTTMPLPIIAESVFAAAIFISAFTLLIVHSSLAPDTQKIMRIVCVILIVCGIHQLGTVGRLWYNVDRLATFITIFTSALAIACLYPFAKACARTSKLSGNKTLENNRQKANTPDDICITTLLSAKAFSSTCWHGLDDCPLGAHEYHYHDKTLTLTYQNATAIALNQNQAKPWQDTITDVFPGILSDSLLIYLRNIAIYGDGVDIDDGQQRNVLSTEKFCLSACQIAENKLLLLFWRSGSHTQTDPVSEIAPLHNQSMLQRAFNGSIAGVYIYAADRNKHEFVNERYAEITGYTPDYITRLSAADLLSLVHEDDRSRVESHFSVLLQSSDGCKAATEHIQYRFRHANGYWIWLLAQDVIFETTGHGVSKIMGSFFDITALRNMQDKLQSTREEAHKASLAKSAFMANMSHEIRTPMNAVLALTEMVLNMEMGGRQREHLNQVHASSRSLLQILNDILDYSKLEADKLEISLEFFDLFALLSEVMQLFTATALQKNLELRCKISPECRRYVTGDHVRLRQILTNLLGNALKFTDEGWICLTVTANKKAVDDDYDVSFSVRDTGIGIAPENIAPLFAPFSQADSSISRQYGGSGLGLTICKRLAHLLNGDISVSSSVNEGSEFTLTIPLKAQQDIHPARALNDKRVTLFSDNAQNMTLLAQYCARDNLQLNDRLALSALRNYQSATDFFIVDISTLEHSQCRATLSDIFSAPHNSHVEAGIIIVSALSTYSKNFSDVLLNAPSKWVCHPLLPSDLQGAMLDLLAQKNAPPVRDATTFSLDFGACRILVVEDNAANQYVAREVLQMMNITADIAVDGASALAMFAKDKYDMVLMDIQMPGLNGFETATAIRRHPEGKETPIIALSAAATERDRQKAIEAGMDAHIAKPIDINELGATLSKWLSHHNNDNSSAAHATAVKAHPAYRLLENFDTEKALSRVANEPVIYRQLLSDFYQQYHQCAENGIDAVISKGSPRDVVLHTLKGLCEAIGATHLAQLSANAMYASNQDAQADVLNDELARVIHCIEPFLSATDTLSESADKPCTTTTIQQLRQVLQARGYISTRDMKSYQAVLLQHFDVDETSRVVQAIHNLDYEQALDALETLMHA
ncbi:response regulator [Salinimonas sp. HHU 13199]|uniref:histidine kinase n=1 Tax=Salinimonas profundi TaxID=2729140 RepID=A0ABR8LK15_9ALTE|nr:ATP-binding protein [Salinimonas profundi]MBD3584274.1 response regulator [Salinimonas profundi]